MCSALQLIEHNSSNDLLQMNGQYRLSVLVLNPIRLTDEVHDVLMDVANLRDGLDYQEEVPNDCSDESDGCASDEYYMINSDSEENMTKDSDDG